MREKSFNSNSYYQGLIQNFYGGSKGCFSAFMHFFYQYNQAKVFHQEYENCFKFLYNCEIENCEILTEALLKMGGDCKFCSHSQKFLSGYTVDYVKSLGQIFLLDIEILEYNIIEVKGMISKIDDLQIRGLLDNILQNKKKALKVLKENYFKNNLL